MSRPSISYKRHHFPPEVIAHTVWLYCRFNPSFREVEEMFLELGIDVSHETIERDMKDMLKRIIPENLISDETNIYVNIAPKL